VTEELGAVDLRPPSVNAHSVGEQCEHAPWRLTLFDCRLEHFERTLLQGNVVIGVLHDEPRCSRTVVADSRYTRPSALIDDLRKTSRARVLGHNFVPPRPVVESGPAASEVLIRSGESKKLITELVIPSVHAIRLPRCVERVHAARSLVRPRVSNVRDLQETLMPTGRIAARLPMRNAALLHGSGVSEVPQTLERCGLGVGWT
jgi:hypothetical protein